MSDNQGILDDLYCLSCGYNLRGLIGAPIRCPECSADNSRMDLAIPAATITKFTRRLEWSASASAGCAMMLLWSMGVSIPAIMEGYPAPCLPCFAGFGAARIGAVLSFRRSCKAQPGWLSALALYHLAAFSLGALLVAHTVPLCLESGAATRFSVFGAVATMIPSLAVVTLLACPAQRALRKRTEPLQRPRAVELARLILMEERRWRSVIQSDGPAT